LASCETRRCTSTPDLRSMSRGIRTRGHDAWLHVSESGCAQEAPSQVGRLSGRGRVIDARNREERDQSAVTLSARQTKSAIDRRPEAA
jgi:hypothetical protein